ncbi:MAG: hypothetical protein PHG30_06065 [Eubacteriales bacterium]|nr:hypothetical protein [Eubacteriales bacterium]MDD3082075.1 hypothetical protein [Desulfobacterales bacterium]
MIHLKNIVAIISCLVYFILNKLAKRVIRHGRVGIFQAVTRKFRQALAFEIIAMDAGVNT